MSTAKYVSLLIQKEQLKINAVINRDVQEAMKKPMLLRRESVMY
jgi:hypothetical protein